MLPSFSPFFSELASSFHIEFILKNLITPSLEIRTCSFCSVSLARQVALLQERLSHFQGVKVRQVVLGQWGVRACIGFLVKNGDLERCLDGLVASSRALAVVPSISALAYVSPSLMTLVECAFLFTRGSAVRGLSVQFPKARVSYLALYTHSLWALSVGRELNSPT